MHLHSAISFRESSPCDASGEEMVVCFVAQDYSIRCKLTARKARQSRNKRLVKRQSPQRPKVDGVEAVDGRDPNTDDGDGNGMIQGPTSHALDR